MNKKLSALKDLPWTLNQNLTGDPFTDDFRNCMLVRRDDLKQEAIKIKKSIDDWSKKGILHKKFSKLSGFKKLNVNTFIRWFFDIKEGDYDE